MIKKLMAVCVFGSCFVAVDAHDFADSSGGMILESFDLSASDIWHGYFLPENILLELPLPHNQQGFRYINHPNYRPNDLPKHRRVCVLDGNGPGNDVQSRCKDEFPHVHLDDFKMALDFSNDLCDSYGPGVVPDFLEPSTFVGYGKTPAGSHHYFYHLAQGLKFDCVALATY